MQTKNTTTFSAFLYNIYYHLTVTLLSFFKKKYHFHEVTTALSVEI